MKRSALLLPALLLVAGAARAATLTVPGQYATPCAAIAAAKANDEVDISGGPYTDSCEINTLGLTVKGVSGQPKIDLSGTNHPADFKGIYVISADNVRIENLELTGAHVDDSEGGNAAGLRITGHGVVVHGCFVHDNQNGILAAPIVDGGVITIESTELSHNGMGDGCDVPGLGCTHNVYVSKNGSSVRYDRTVFQDNWSHDLSTDTTKDKGHLLKSRSRETDVLYNRISGEMGGDSYEVDIPNGGLAILVGNVIEKGPNADNPTMVAYGEEGIDNTDLRIFVVGNTMVNDFTSGTFLNIANGGVLVAHDNILAGAGTPSSTGALSADNLSGVDPVFVNAAMYDYELMAGSPAIGKAVPPGSADAFSLVPLFEYVQPLMTVGRGSDKDLGAYEHDNVVPDGGAPAGDAGAPPGADAALQGGGLTPSSGCGCVAAGERAGRGAGLAGLFIALGLLRVRRAVRRRVDAVVHPS